MQYLDESDTRLKLALQVTDTRIWEWNILTGQVAWSENFEHLFGLAPGMLKRTYRGLLKRILPADRRAVTQAIARAIREKTDYNIEFRICCPDKSIRWLKSQGKVDCDQHSHPVKVTGVCRDITLDKQAVAPKRQYKTKRKHSPAALKMSEPQLKCILNSLEDVVWSASVDTFELLYLNPAAEAIYGRPLSEFFENQNLHIEVIHPEDRAQVWAKTQKLLETSSYEMEYRIVRPSGEIRWLRDRTRVILDANGKMIRVDGIATDITQYKQLLAAKEQENEALKVRVQELSRELIQGEGVPAAIFEGVGCGETTWQEREGQEITVSQDFMSHQSGSALVELISTFARDMTPHQQAKAAQARSEAKWRSLIQNSSDLITILSADGIILYVSPSIERLLGYSPDELVGQPVLKYIASQERKAIRKAIRNVLVAGNRVTLPPMVLRFLCKNGSWCFLESSGTNLLADEAVAGLVINSRDVTERFRVQEALRQSEVRFRAIFEGAALGIALSDPSGELLTTNPAMHKLFGYTEEELRQRTITHPDDVTADFNLYQALLAGSLPSYQMEKRYFHKNGNLVWGRLTVSLVRDKAGRPLFVVGMVEDITGAKQTEAELLRISKAVENASDAISIADTLGTRLIYVNPAFNQMFGYTLEELSVAGGSFILFPDPKIMQEVLAIAISGHSWQGEVEMLSCGGVLKQIALRTDAIKDVNGEVVGTIAIHTDITERKQALKALRRSYYRAELLKQITTEIRSSLDLDQIFQTTVTQLGWALQVNRCMIHLYQDTPQPRLLLVAEYLEKGYSSMQEFEEMPVQGNPLVERLLATDQAIASTDVYAEPLLEAVVHQCRAMDIKSMLSIRISYQGEPNGVLGLHQCDSYRKWKISDVELLEAVAAQVGIALAQANLLEKEKRTAAQLAEQNLALQLSEARASTKATELEQALYELQRTQAQLVQTEKMSSLGQLVAGVAHEINNPVSFITGNISYACDYIHDLLRVVKLYRQHYPQPVEVIQAEIEKIDLDFLIEDLPKLLKSMKVGTDRIHQIVLSLRNFSRLDESDMKPVDIHEGIDNTLMILQNRLKAKGESPEIEVIKEYGTLPPVECYPGQLNQVFMNLISNAIDALEEGPAFEGASSVEALALAKRGVVQRLEEGAPSGESSTLAIAGEGLFSLASRFLPCIHICTEANGDRVVIRITDNGAGMTEEVKQQLFNPFFTTKPVGKGTGLGLSISYQIVVEKHGGELHCFSVPGQGTQFIIEIPIEHSPE